MTFADQGASSVVGDLPGYGEEAYFHEDGTYADIDYVSPTSHAAYSGLQQAPAQYQQYAPVGAAELQPGFQQPAYQQVGHHLDYVGGPSCDNACDGACSDGSCASCLNGCNAKKICSIFDCDHDTWAQAEFLLWFAQNRSMPALVTTSDPGTFPDLPEGGPNNVQIEFGDEIEGGLSGGFRGDIGAWVSDNVGIGGCFWVLSERSWRWL